jgi:hypothetical protein
VVILAGLRFRTFLGIYAQMPDLRACAGGVPLTLSQGSEETRRQG